MSRTIPHLRLSWFQGLCSLVLVSAMFLLVGCSGGDDTSVASATSAESAPAPAPEPKPEPKPEPEEEEDEGYGSEDYAGAPKARASSGGGDSYSSYEAQMAAQSGSGGDDYGMGGDYGDDYGMGDDYGDDYGGGMMASGMGGMSDDYGDDYGASMGMDGYDEYEGGGGTGMLDLGAGMGGPSGPPGRGPADPEAGLAMGFVSQNCFNCHSSRQTKGGVNLEFLTADFSDHANVELWNRVVEQVDSGAMPPASARQPDPAQKSMLVSFVKRSC